VSKKEQKVFFRFNHLINIFLHFRPTPFHLQVPQVTQPPVLPNFPLDPLALRAAFNPYLPFQLPTQPLSHFPPVGGTLTSNQALSTLASKKRSANNDYEDNIISEAKRQRYEDPLDLSLSHLDEDDDDVIDVLSLDSPMTSRNDVDSWNVDQAANFVANVETCQQYAKVRFLFLLLIQRNFTTCNPYKTVTLTIFHIFGNIRIEQKK